MRAIRFVTLGLLIVATTCLTLSALRYEWLLAIGVLSLGIFSIGALCQLIIKGENE